MVWGIQWPQKKKKEFWPGSKGQADLGPRKDRETPTRGPGVWTGSDWLPWAVPRDHHIELQCLLHQAGPTLIMSQARHWKYSGVDKLKQISLPISSPKKGNLLFTHLHRMCSYILLQKKNTCCIVTAYTDVRHHRKLELNRRAEQTAQSQVLRLKL